MSSENTHARELKYKLQKVAKSFVVESEVQGLDMCILQSCLWDIGLKPKKKHCNQQKQN